MMDDGHETGKCQYCLRRTMAGIKPESLQTTRTAFATEIYTCGIYFSAGEITCLGKDIKMPIETSYEEDKWTNSNTFKGLREGATSSSQKIFNPSPAAFPTFQRVQTFRETEANGRGRI